MAVASRHIYQPFRGRPFLLPFLASTEIDFPPRRNEATPPPPPGLYLRDAVEMFVRESSGLVPVQVYRIECWDTRDTATIPDHTIPLLARLEISVRVEARYYQKSQQDPRKLSEIVKSVGLPQPQLQLQYAKMNVFGACTTTVSLESIVYDGVVLANVPIAKDPCFPANPTEKYLEMYAQSHGAVIGSGSGSGSGSRKGRAGSGYGELRCRVGVVDITAFEGPFSVLVDNSLFGPFFRIVISADDLVLPFRSLFPISS